MKKRDDLIKDKQEAPEGGLSRRRFMGAAALAGVAGATGLGSTIMTRESFAAAAKEAKNKIYIEPGELDEYYGFWSGGHQGEVRVLGVPSMRELMRIPVFNVDPATGSSPVRCTAAICARWVPRWRCPPSCVCSTGSSAARSAVTLAACVTTSVKYRRSTRMAPSTTWNATTAWIAR